MGFSGCNGDMTPIFDGDVIVTPPAGSNGSGRNGVLTGKLCVWNPRISKRSLPALSFLDPCALA